MKIAVPLIAFVVGVMALMTWESPWNFLVGIPALLLVAKPYYAAKRKAFRKGYDPRGTASEEEINRAETVAGLFGYTSSLKDDIKRISGMEK